ncbi:MAG TPA: hypothetical protein VK633_11115 [Verrucomicrobiae bacterium]|nr:hypothetical protein [Verrucomicrobiae bacterium]
MRAQVNFVWKVGFSTVVPLLVLTFLLGAQFPAHAAGKKKRDLPDEVQRVGTIDDVSLVECSGVVASRQFPGILWTHNDGGGRRASLYAMNRAGKVTARFPIVGVALEDWEDLAIDGSKQLYLADTGNNEQKRRSISIHQIDEPNPANPNARLMPKQSWTLTYPGKPFDCESLFVWGEFGYVISKVFDDRAAELYRFPLAAQTRAVPLERVAELPITSPVTGATISADGAVIGVISKAGAFAFTVGGQIEPGKLSAPYRIKFKHDHVEGCCFVPGGLLITAESREIFLLTDPAFQTDTPRPRAN